jgi:chaperonin GroES
MTEEKSLEALFDAIIVKPLESDESIYGNIIVPDMGDQTNEKAQVIGVGPGKYTVNGEFISTQLKKGDVVILPTMGFTKFSHNREEFYVGPENQILAKINSKK